MAKTNRIAAEAADSEYCAIIFAKLDRCCGRHFVISESSSNMATSDIQPSL